MNNGNTTTIRTSVAIDTSGADHRKKTIARSLVGNLVSARVSAPPVVHAVAMLRRGRH